jgi:hypothetical protein
MTRAEKNLWQQTATFEPLWNGQHGLIPRKKPTAKNDDGLMSKNSRGDWTPLELFIAGVRGWEAGSRRFIDTSDSCKYRFKEKH